MAKKKQTKPKSAQDRALRRKNRWKAFRSVLQWVAIAALLAYILWEYILPEKVNTYVETKAAAATAKSAGGEDGDDAADNGRFITVAYSGIVETENRESTIVSRQSFEEQIAALKASGYVTISQQDIVDYYLYHGSLPQKAMFLLFEDGIRETTALVQPYLEKHNYRATVCTYASNLHDVHSRFLTISDLKALQENTYWELGVNGYRLSYINVFDRYDNYFGHLNTNEYGEIYQYLRRDYNHWLMDFLRDEDRLRQESEEEMRERIAFDYEGMRELYIDAFDYLPLTYVLMHSNTGMFATDSTVSVENRNHLTELFAMNFNRQGSCLNTLESSVYDLTRIQPQPYWSTNHLLMRIWDDTKDDVAFVTGDEEQAAKWYEDVGQTEFKDGNIIVTSQPYGYGRVSLKATLVSDLDLTTTFDGNIVGEQAIYLRSDRMLSSGVRVALENNHLTIGEVADGESTATVDIDLFLFDGGATMSEEEDAHEGLIALQDAIIDYDEDDQRREEAAAELTRLEAMHVPSLEEGGTPYVPELDIADRGRRKVRILLVDNRLSVWIDDRPAVENMSVSVTKRGTVVLESTPWQPDEDYSQRNLHDDVYDAVFADLRLTAPGEDGTVYYEYVKDTANTALTWLETAWLEIRRFFLNYF